ncbi:MAG: peptidylprolyl isomerase [Elusimicrobiota bacterium]
MIESTVIKKRKNNILNNNSLVIIGFFILFGVTIGLLLRNSCLIARNDSSGGVWTIPKMREYASKLKADGLTVQAMRAFEEYLDKSNADAKTRCNIYYSLGEMFLHSDRYEDALSYFYKAEISDPGTELKKDIGTYIVTCLEKMGKSLDAEYQLESRAALQGEKKYKKGAGEVVARIGSRDITMGEINEEIEKLPAWMREEYTKNESKKLEFLQQYVSSELLYGKGSKLGYARDPQVRDEVESFSRQLVVQKVIENEVTGKINIDPDDVKNYYEANKVKYKDESGKIKSFEDAKYSVTLDYRMEKSQKLAQDLLADILNSKDVDIYADKFIEKMPLEKKREPAKKEKPGKGEPKKQEKEAQGKSSEEK